MSKTKFKKLVLSTLISGVITNLSVAHADHSVEKRAIAVDKIVVTAKSNSTLDSIAATVNVINAEDIAKSGASTLQDVLEKVPGFSFTTNSSSTYGRKNIGLRGMDSQHILILQDGERTNATDGFIGHSNFQSSYFDINSIERIEIIKGAGSVLYGSEAMGGVINIITKAGAEVSYAQAKLSKGFVDSRSGGDSTGISFGAGEGYDNFYGSFNFSNDSQDYVENDDGSSVDFEEVKNRTIMVLYLISSRQTQNFLLILWILMKNVTYFHHIMTLKEANIV